MNSTGINSDYKILTLTKKYIKAHAGLKTVTLTQSDYDELLENDSIESEVFYMIKDEDGE